MTTDEKSPERSASSWTTARAADTAIDLAFCGLTIAALPAATAAAAPTASLSLFAWTLALMKSCALDTIANVAVNDAAQRKMLKDVGGVAVSPFAVTLPMAYAAFSQFGDHQRAFERSSNLVKALEAGSSLHSLWDGLKAHRQSAAHVAETITTMRGAKSGMAELCAFLNEQGLIEDSPSMGAFGRNAPSCERLAIDLLDLLERESDPPDIEVLEIGHEDD